MIRNRARLVEKSVSPQHWSVLKPHDGTRLSAVERRVERCEPGLDKLETTPKEQNEKISTLEKVSDEQSGKITTLE
jgi:hypothetical protein